MRVRGHPYTTMPNRCPGGLCGRGIELTGVAQRRSSRTRLSVAATTSGYGSASFEFASGKPMELIDGSNLLYLLAEHAQVAARIDPNDLD